MSIIIVFITDIVTIKQFDQIFHDDWSPSKTVLIFQSQKQIGDNSATKARLYYTAKYYKINKNSFGF